MAQRGKLILLEGLDRTGKTTQCERLVDILKETMKIEKVKQFKFPNRENEIGKLINGYLTNSSNSLSDQAIHLLFSANRWESINEIKNLLNEGYYVILDRYVYSGVAYSLAKEVEGMDIDWCLNCDKGLIKPDLTIFLTNDKTNKDREGFGDERYEKIAFQLKVKEKFFEIFTKIDNYNQETQHSSLAIVNVTNKTIEEVTDLIANASKNILTNKQYDVNSFSYF
ncbi:hypothetical protein TPHA_0F03510 [Tetrapisispora phaffii CBS 4417]|uniref:Thymidylate kinase n=1 Tax=Tetrapisispora phaffii (strain ATCC 24235 / CBS 4417 / NBRC 1672 / NRRL Y-8282 / UCD 70-5) TaxID=1071381 RepID=G8BUP5_TETPH|nr:hypothetical protein TPHA_0F03510 [Tetrapisispora phaffii CBS 4417]CCE63831.1 hypothetical protein TPHA_0F03510 [Tetrapisispora phaffii CBS 4417]